MHSGYTLFRLYLILEYEREYDRHPSPSVDAPPLSYLGSQNHLYTEYQLGNSPDKHVNLKEGLNCQAGSTIIDCHCSPHDSHESSRDRREGQTIDNMQHLRIQCGVHAVSTADGCNFTSCCSNCSCSLLMVFELLTCIEYCHL